MTVGLLLAAGAGRRMGRLGASGLELARHARGLDDRPVENASCLTITSPTNTARATRIGTETATQCGRSSVTISSPGISSLRGNAMAARYRRGPAAATLSAGARDRSRHDVPAGGGRPHPT